MMNLNSDRMKTTLHANFTLSYETYAPEECKVTSRFVFFFCFFFHEKVPCSQ